MKPEKEIRKVTLVGTAVNVVLSAGKLVAGIVGASAAMVADAVHSLSDLATDIVVLLCVPIARRPADATHRYGHGKYETVATVIIGAALLAVGIGIAWNGIVKVIAVINGEVLPRPGLIAFVAAAVSIVVKEWLYRYTVRTGRRLNSRVVIANAWHHRSDAFSSVGTLLGIGGAYFLGVRWSVLDPITAIVVSVFIVKVAIDIAHPGIDELLEKSLPKEDEERIVAIVMEQGEVSDPHNLRTRRIGDRIAIELHLRVEATKSVEAAHAITKQIESAIFAEFGTNTHITIHIEPKK